MSASKPDVALFIVLQKAHSQSQAEILQGPGLNSPHLQLPSVSECVKVVSMHTGLMSSPLQLLRVR